MRLSLYQVCTVIYVEVRLCYVVLQLLLLFSRFSRTYVNGLTK